MNRPLVRMCMVLAGVLLGLGTTGVTVRAFQPATAHVRQERALVVYPLNPGSQTSEVSWAPALQHQVVEAIVARVYYADEADLGELAGRLDLWEVNKADRYVVAQLRLDEYLILLARGYRVEIDQARTAQLNTPRAALPGQVNGIPGYPCYRTVEETYAAAQAIAAAHPDLAEWIDIGDSWEKITPGGAPGYDLMVLKLTKRNISGPKPVYFAMSSMHAREYTPAELNTRFAEYLINHYGSDPDVTWLLDYTEVHLLLQANPDGRKQAEAGLSWRKNTNNNYCSNTNSRGADLNRNWPFMWNSCAPGSGCSSGNPCDLTYRGSAAASEPETQAAVNYVRSIFPDYRPIDDLTTPVPVTATGFFMDLHSYSELVLWPWGFTTNTAPNATALQTLGRKFAYFNNYAPGPSVGLYPTDGTTDDTAYGELGIPAYTFELGTAFFQSCTIFQNTIYPNNLPALLYAVKAAHRPYAAPAGPDVLNLTAAPTVTLPGAQVTLNAVANDTRYHSGSGEAVQNIIAARYAIDLPSWLGAATYPLAASDGSFNSAIEAITGQVETTYLSPGRHILFVEAQDAAGNWGVPTAVFLHVELLPGLAPQSASQIGLPGETVTYTLHMSNTGNLTDTFTLNAAGNSWPVVMSPVTATLAPQQSHPLVVSVTIPITAPGNSTDTVSMSMVGSNITAYSVLTTTASVVRGVQLQAVTVAQNGYLGQTVEYALTLTNTGNLSDTFTLYLSAHLWPTSVEPQSLTVPAFTASPLTARVTVPLTAPLDFTDTVTITAIGIDAADSVTLQTTARAAYAIWLPLLRSD